MRPQKLNKDTEARKKMEPGKYVQKIEVTRYIGEVVTLDSLIAWLGWDESKGPTSQG